MSTPQFDTVATGISNEGAAGDGGCSGILTITMNRPEVKNAFNNQLYKDMVSALEFAGSSDRVAAVVITGAGSFFSSGADLKSSGAERETPSSTAPVGRFMKALMGFPKPAIAAVNGPAIGIGTTMLAHVDVAYAAEGAYFWTPFSRIAVVPEFCSSVLFAQILGPSVANEMLLMSKQLTTDRALARGFVAEVFRPEALMREVMARVQHMLSFAVAARSTQLFKGMINQRRLPLLRQVFEMEMAELDKRFESGDTLAAVMFMMQQAAKEKEAKAAKAGVARAATSAVAAAASGGCDCGCGCGCSCGTAKGDDAALASDRVGSCECAGCRRSVGAAEDEEEGRARL